MSKIFLTLLNSSLTTCWLIGAVLIARLLLKKAPKWVNCVLWVLVAVRLVLPIQIESVLSLVPSAQPIPLNIEMMQRPVIHSGITIVDTVVNPVIMESSKPTLGHSVNPLQIALGLASAIWLFGMAVMVIYAVYSYLRLQSKVKIGIREDGRVYVCDEVEMPFILGVFHPTIYLPSSLNAHDKEYILAHENAHLNRGDHLWKPFGYWLLTLYWFNPLCWVAYILLCRDIELACDEKVTESMNHDDRAEYCQVLLNYSSNRQKIMACPVAFGEVGVKERIKSVMNYKKPAFWVIAIAVVICVLVGVCFLTNPKEDRSSSQAEEIRIPEITILPSEPVQVQSQETTAEQGEEALLGNGLDLEKLVTILGLEDFDDIQKKWGIHFWRQFSDTKEDERYNAKNENHRCYAQYLIDNELYELSILYTPIDLELQRNPNNSLETPIDKSPIERIEFRNVDRLVSTNLYTTDGSPINRDITRFIAEQPDAPSSAERAREVFQSNLYVVCENMINEFMHAVNAGEEGDFSTYISNPVLQDFVKKMVEKYPHRFTLDHCTDLQISIQSLRDEYTIVSVIPSIETPVTTENLGEMLFTVRSEFDGLVITDWCWYFKDFMENHQNKSAYSMEENLDFWEQPDKYEPYLEAVLQD